MQARTKIFFCLLFIFYEMSLFLVTVQYCLKTSVNFLFNFSQRKILKIITKLFQNLVNRLFQSLQYSHAGDGGRSEGGSMIIVQRLIQFLNGINLGEVLLVILYHQGKCGVVDLVYFEICFQVFIAFQVGVQLVFL